MQVLSHRTPALLIALSFVPEGTKESSRTLVPGTGSFSSRPWTLEALSRALLEARCRWAGAAVPSPRWHSSTALQASLRDAPPFHHQPGTEVPGYFQPSLPGRRAAKGVDVLWDDCISFRARMMLSKFFPLRTFKSLKALVIRSKRIRESTKPNNSKSSCLSSIAFKVGPLIYTGSVLLGSIG